MQPGDFPGLMARATDHDKNVRNAIAYAVGKLGDDEEVRRAIPGALAHPQWRVRFAAVRAVSWWPAQLRPVECVRDLLADPVASVRWAAVNAVPGDETAMVAPLASTDPAPTVRAAAVSAFWSIDGREAVRLGVRCLDDPDDRVRLAAVVLLRDRGDPEARSALIGSLEDRYMWIRTYSIQGLRNIGGAEVVEPILARLHDRKRWVRYEAALALGALGDARAVEPLLSLLGRSSSAFGKKAAVVGLGHLRYERAVSPIADVLRGVWTDDPRKGGYAFFGEGRREFELRRDATKALLRIGGSEAEAELALLPRKWVRWVRKMNLF